MSTWDSEPGLNKGAFRKRIAAALIEGGLEISKARTYCGINKMPMQYYIRIRNIERPKLGTSQRHLKMAQIRTAFDLLNKGATPKEIFHLTGVALGTLQRYAMTQRPAPRRRGRPPKKN